MNSINAALMASLLCATMKTFTAADSVLPNEAKMKNVCRHEESVVVSVTRKTKNSHKVGKVTDSRRTVLYSFVEYAHFFPFSGLLQDHRGVNQALLHFFCVFRKNYV